MTTMIPEKREEITLPWLNTIFQAHGIKVHGFTFTGEASNGRGFMGTLEQVELEITRLPNHSSSFSTDPDSTVPRVDGNQTSNSTETLHIILKTLPQDSQRRVYAANGGFSTREVSMYMNVFSAWEKFLDNRQVPLSNRFRHPFCYYVAEEGDCETYKYILVMENLTAPNSNFHLWTTGFNDPLPWSAASAVIRQIARFHATGIAYKIENRIDSYIKVFPKIHHTGSPGFEQIWHMGFQITKEVIEATVDKQHIPEGLFEQLDKLKADENRDLLLKWFTDPARTFGDKTTICHHDLHSNNLVLSSDHSLAVLFDYQASCAFNPMKDMSFFLTLNCQLEDSTNNLTRALQLYHDEFAKTMTAIKTDFTYNMESIRKDYDFYLGFSIAHIMSGGVIWITGKDSTEESKRRYTMVVIDTYKRGFLKFPTQELN